MRCSLTSDSPPPATPFEEAATTVTLSSPNATPNVRARSKSMVDEHAELQRLGAKAAARGEHALTNPMLDSANQPDATGESSKTWADRRDAWSRGHLAQQTDVPRALVASSAGREPAQDQALFGVTRVMTFHGTLPLTAASGFFFEREGRLFLITSRHVLFDAATGHAPDRIEIELHTDARDLTQIGRLSALLYRDGQAEWIQAQDSGGDVDVAALALDRSALPQGYLVRPFTPLDLPTHGLEVVVGDRLVIPGFPLGFFDTLHHLPVVRQAAVASCYGIRFQGAGYFLTDARMHRGCSGSPVLAPVSDAATGQRWQLLGIHSSRMDMADRNSELDESLGLNCAWYADVLMTLTAAPCPASSRVE